MGSSIPDKTFRPVGLSDGPALDRPGRAAVLRLQLRQGGIGLGQGGKAVAFHKVDLIQVLVCIPAEDQENLPELLARRPGHFLLGDPIGAGIVAKARDMGISGTPEFTHSITAEGSFSFNRVITVGGSFTYLLMINKGHELGAFDQGIDFTATARFNIL